jgi:O-antigen/teichoic acid export membrane protein
VTATATPTPTKTKADGLVVDGLALGGSALLSALAGFLSWLVAARTQPQAVVSTASAFVSAFILVASLAELSLGPAFLRWLPQAGHRVGRLIRNVYVCVLGAALVLSAIWLLVPASRAVLAATYPLSPAFGAALFTVCAMSWVLFHLQDEVLTGLHVAKWVPLENLLAAVSRLLLLVLLAPLLGALGIVLAWAITTVVTVAAISVGVTIAARRRRSIQGRLPTRSQVIRFSGSMYPANIASSVTAHLVPLIVIARYGPEDGAVFFIVWMGLSALELAGIGLGNAMATRLAGGQHWTERYVARSSARFILFALPVLVVGFLAAGLALSIFGPAYQATGTDLLRWVIVGFAVRLFVLLGTAVYIGAGRGMRWCREPTQPPPWRWSSCCRRPG